MHIAIGLLYFGMLCITVNFFFPGLFSALMFNFVRMWAIPFFAVLLLLFDWVALPILSIFSADAREANAAKPSLKSLLHFICTKG